MGNWSCTRIRFLKEIEVDRPQDTEEDYGMIWSQQLLYLMVN